MSRVTKSDVAFFVSQYRDGKTMTDIAEAWGCNRSTVKYWLEREGVEFRSTSDLARSSSGHYLNEYAFDLITSESAYWIGFLMADGAIHKNTVALCLNEQDSWHVEKFRHYMGGNQKVIEIEKQKSVRYAFESAYVVSKLAKYGVGERKSHTAVASAELATNRHFWRGVVDGDGYIAVVQHKGKLQARFELVGSRMMCEQLSGYARQCVAVNHRASVRKHRTIYSVAFSGKTAQEVINHLYDNAELALDRKATVSYQVGLL